MSGFRVNTLAILLGVVLLVQGDVARAQAPAPRAAVPNRPRMSVREAAPAEPAASLYTVVGAVALPAVFTTRAPQATLSQLIAAAGGLLPEADPSLCLLHNGKMHRISIAAGIPASDQIIFPGTLIVVSGPRRQLVVPVRESTETIIPVACLGLADRPWVLPLDAKITTIDALLVGLNQPASLAEHVKVIDPFGRRAQRELLPGSVVLFDWRYVDQRALQSVPPPPDVVDLDAPSASAENSEGNAAAPPAAPEPSIETSTVDLPRILPEPPTSEAPPVVAPLILEATATLIVNDASASSAADGDSDDDWRAGPPAFGPQVIGIDEFLAPDANSGADPLARAHSSAAADEEATRRRIVAPASLNAAVAAGPGANPLPPMPVFAQEPDAAGHLAMREQATDRERSASDRRFAQAFGEALLVAGAAPSQATAPERGTFSTETPARRPAESGASAHGALLSTATTIADGSTEAGPAAPVPAKAQITSALILGSGLLILVCGGSLTWILTRSRREQQTALAELMSARRERTRANGEAADSVQDLLDRQIPIMEEPAPVRKLWPLHGEAVGHRRIILNSAHDSPPAPHFARPRAAHRRQVAAGSARQQEEQLRKALREATRSAITPGAAAFESLLDELEENPVAPQPSPPAAEPAGAASAIAEAPSPPPVVERPQNTTFSAPIDDEFDIVQPEWNIDRQQSQGPLERALRTLAGEQRK